jgi:hypothetical protein
MNLDPSVFTYIGEQRIFNLGDTISQLAELYILYSYNYNTFRLSKMVSSGNLLVQGLGGGCFVRQPLDFGILDLGRAESTFLPCCHFPNKGVHYPWIFMRLFINRIKKKLSTTLYTT